MILAADYDINRSVSILVLMEDDLKGTRLPIWLIKWLVSILVLMEDDLKEKVRENGRAQKNVSILVLMEDDLKGNMVLAGRWRTPSFNPCFNGR